MTYLVILSMFIIANSGAHATKDYTMKYNLSAIMITAHRINRATGAGLAVALRLSWELEKTRIISRAGKHGTGKPWIAAVLYRLYIQAGNYQSAGYISPTPESKTEQYRGLYINGNGCQGLAILKDVIDRLAA